VKKTEAIMHEPYPDTHHDVYSKTTFGFWLYLLTDFILFGTLFASYAVLRNNTFGGPSARDLFDLPYPMLQSIILLISSYTIGLAGASAHRRNKNWVISLLALTFLLGIAFMAIQLTEWVHFLRQDYTWSKSAFLSMYYTIISTFGIHMIFALLWVIVLGVPVWREGITPMSLRRVICLKMFWQFLNIIWIFIFSFIYLMGGI